MADDLAIEIRLARGADVTGDEASRSTGLRGTRERLVEGGRARVVALDEISASPVTS